MDYILLNVDKILIGLFSVIELIAVAVFIIYLAESTTSNKILDYTEYMNLVNSFHAGAVIALILIWFFSVDNVLVVYLFLLFIVLWILLAIAYLVIGSRKKWNREFRSILFKLMRSAIVKAVVLGVFTWLIH